MAETYEIRADHDATGIVMYQAYGDAIADAAIEHQRFVPPFSSRRMTWIKPSFLWLMHRSQWAKKSGQTRILAVRISRVGWESALGQAVWTSPHPSLHDDADAWRRDLERAAVHLQWDPERSLRGAALDHYSIQVGIGRGLIETFASQWVLEIRDETSRVREMRALLDRGQIARAKAKLPKEAVYRLHGELARRVGTSSSIGKGRRRR